MDAARAVPADDRNHNASQTTEILNESDSTSSFSFRSTLVWLFAHSAVAAAPGQAVGRLPLGELRLVDPSAEARSCPRLPFLGWRALHEASTILSANAVDLWLPTKRRHRQPKLEGEKPGEAPPATPTRWAPGQQNSQKLPQWDTSSMGGWPHPVRRGPATNAQPPQPRWARGRGAGRNNPSPQVAWPPRRGAPLPLPTHLRGGGAAAVDIPPLPAE